MFYSKLHLPFFRKESYRLSSFFIYCLPRTFNSQVNNSHQDVKVQGIFQGNYYDTSAKVQAAIAAGAPPSISQVEISNVSLYADAGALEDLTPYVKKSKVNTRDFIPGLMDYSYWKKKLVAIPFNRSTPLFYFNKKHLQEAGLDLSGPKTWDELETFAKKLTIPGKRWGYCSPIDTWFYEAMIFQNGGNILSSDRKHIGFNNQIGLAPIMLWRKMIDAGIMKMPPGKEYNSWDVAKQSFLNETVSMIVSSTGDVAGLMKGAEGKFEVGTCFLPKAKRYGVPTGGANLVMFAKQSPAQKKAAWQFMNWLTAKRQTIVFSQNSGYMPNRLSAVESQVMQDYFKAHPQFKTAIDQLQYTDLKRPMHPSAPQLENVVMMNEIQKAMIDRSYSPQQALKTIDTAALELFK
jgi:sn-glycerol 3-phosphate transport system substrate-binding protein